MVPARGVQAAAASRFRRRVAGLGRMSDVSIARQSSADAGTADASAVTATPAPRVAIAMPGGFEAGGIGRMMMYATAGWAGSAAAPRWWVVDGRGPGHLAWSPLHLVKALAGLAWHRPDLLHINVAGRGSTLRKLLMSELAGALRIATIVHLHDYDYAADLARRPAWLRRRITAMFRRARRVIVLGERDRETVEGELGVPAARVVVLHNAVPDPGPPPDRRGRAGPTRLVFLGHLDDRKGVPELLEALSRPALRSRDWQLVLAGGGELARFRQVIATAGLAWRCEVAGWVTHEQVYERCREADIFVLPSHAEGQAMALLEAMAHGLAIVTTPVGAHLEAVEPDTEALLVQPGNVDELTDALCTMIDQPERRLALGMAARRKYCCQFNAYEYARKMRQIYAKSLGENRP
jgi:glycosyltransferase involved in cell wall biosynthesis